MLLTQWLGIPNAFLVKLGVIPTLPVAGILVHPYCLVNHASCLDTQKEIYFYTFTLRD